jgi:uncharacterized protein GlcG (DUF336 family)
MALSLEGMRRALFNRRRSAGLAGGHCRGIFMRSTGHFVGVAALLGALLAAAPALADDITATRQLSVALADEAAQAALASCVQSGYRVSVAVYDRSGLLRAYLRGDGAGPHTFDTATRKAYSSASLGASTSDLQKRVASDPAAAGLVNIPGVLILAGGLPIKIGNEVIGGIGVGGAPGGDKDEACSQAGLAKIQDRLK